jgi:hypothetical protein
MKVGVSALALCLAASVAQAWHISGKVLCDDGNRQFSGGDTPVPDVLVVVQGGGVTHEVMTNASGAFSVEVAEPAPGNNAITYKVFLKLVPASSIILPAAKEYNVTLSHYPNIIQFENANFLLDCSGPPADGPGTRTPGYWKNHPDAWPVATITIGGVTYTKAEALALMIETGDRTYTMFSHLLAAKLNIAAGTPSGCIAATVEAADIWLAAFPLGSGVSGNSAAWKTAEPWKNQLDAYNNGKLCASAAK